ncbi:MAG: DoxX family protein [Bacteroidales bacterium]|nr:DoxX family protein [Bacteroidales bacterium]
MKWIFSIKYSQTLLHFWLLVSRVLISVFMLTHGWPKLMRFFSEDSIRFADPLGVGVIPSLLLAVFSEVVCSLFIILGLGTRAASIPLIITMAVAAFVVHADDPFARKEMALLYLLAYIMLLIFGSGKYSIDRYFRK